MVGLEKYSIMSSRQTDRTRLMLAVLIASELLVAMIGVATEKHVVAMLFSFPPSLSAGICLGCEYAYRSVYGTVAT